MPPASKRNGTVILLDVKTHPEFAIRARECLLNIFATKQIVKPKDTVIVVLINVDETKNNPYEQYSGKRCRHIKVLDETPVRYDPNRLLQQITPDPDTADASFFEALIVAYDLMEQYYINENGIVNKQIVLISDFSASTGVTASEKGLHNLVNSFNSNNVSLYVFGPKTVVPFCLKSSADVVKWSSTVEFVESDNANLSVVRTLVQKTARACASDLVLARHLFHSFAYGYGAQPFACPLTIGSRITLKTRMIRTIRPPLKYKVVPSRDNQPNPSGNSGYTAYLAEDALQEVSYDNIVGGVWLHGRFNSLPNDVKKDFQVIGPRRFKIVGFTPRSKIPETIIRGKTSVICTDKTRLTQLLVAVLRRRNMVAIAYRAYFKNAKPVLFALLPDKAINRFVAVEMEYGDGHVKYTSKDADNSCNDKPVDTPLSRFLDGLDVVNKDNKCDDGSVPLALAPNVMLPIHFNMGVQRILQKMLEGRADIEPNVGLPLYIVKEDSCEELRNEF